MAWRDAAQRDPLERAVAAVRFAASLELVAIAADRFEIRFGIRAAARLIDDVVNVTGCLDATSSTTRLTHTVIANEDALSQLLPYRTVASLLPCSTLNVRRPTDGLALVLFAVARHFQ